MCVPLSIHPPRGLSHFLGRVGRGALALVPDPPLHLPSRKVDTFPGAVHPTEWGLQKPGPSAGALQEAQTLHTEVVIKCLLNENTDDGVSRGSPRRGVTHGPRCEASWRASGQRPGGLGKGL